MYLHICKNIIIRTEEIIGIFDIEIIGKTKEYEQIYKKLKDEGNIEDVSNGQKKTFILTKKKGEYQGYVSNISVGTLAIRATDK